MAQPLIPMLPCSSACTRFYQLCPLLSAPGPVTTRLSVFSSFGDMLSFTLTAFVELMDHGIVSWDTFSVAFIKKVMPIVLLWA